jgi:SAM-dependent methyltransferase
VSEDAPEVTRSLPTPTGTAAWRQPPPQVGPPADDAARGGTLKRALSQRLAQVFEDSEDENHRVILAMAAAGPPRRRLLDLGCYNGAFTVDLGRAARAEQLTGVEWLPEHAQHAQARGVEVSQHDLDEPLPFAEDAFDLVHANQVIEHLRSTDAFIREVARVLAPGGRALLSTNNLASWHNVVSLTLGFQPLPSHVSDEVHVGNPLDPRRGLRHADVGQTHLRVFTSRALVELAAAHGLVTTATQMNGYYPLPPRLARHASRRDPRHAAFMVVELAHAPDPTAP